MSFESAAGLTGGITTIQVLDPVRAPSTVLRLGQPWSIRVNWFIQGPAAEIMGGEWHLAAFVESVGQGDEERVALSTPPIPVGSAPYDMATQRRNYGPVDLPVLPTQINREAVYKLVVVLTHTIGGVRTQTAGFFDGPLMQFYQA